MECKNVRHILTRMDGNNLLIVQVDETIEVVVNGYGSGEATIEVRAMHGWDGGEGVGEPISGVTGFNWGECVVYAEPLTIAHLVVDVVNNRG